MQHESCEITTLENPAAERVGHAVQTCTVFSRQRTSIHQGTSSHSSIVQKSSASSVSGLKRKGIQIQ